MTETLETFELREAHENALRNYWRALVDGRGPELVNFYLGESEGLARALGVLEAKDPIEAHVEGVAAIVARSEEGRSLAARAREALVANLRR